ncbi:hypothetical protein O181_049078 [Austropuccinia psidii MF-1]|uniref:Vacuolar protein sorting-associated protein 13 VPS13 adaptor binding domain-containing protein n=1 Tax=Austropuccinia psidii MF-1 TaxID=1389203 RepID=A0A9Q3HL25_9BASI|nr:hypothetical protein [Austropuccinia psidii MF-1]
MCLSLIAVLRILYRDFLLIYSVYCKALDFSHAPHQGKNQKDSTPTTPKTIFKSLSPRSPLKCVSLIMRTPSYASPTTLAAYHQRIKIRPDPGFGFKWCKEALTWKDLVKHPVRTITCQSIDLEEPAWCFTAATIYDEEDSTVRLRLKLKICYRLIFNLMPSLHYPLSGGAFKIQIYCPYVIINKTGLDSSISSKPLMRSPKSVADHNLCGNASRHSNWSKAINFDVVGANQQVTMQTSTKTSEYRVGLNVSEGLGKYNLTKVVIIYPRFITETSSY